MISSIPMDWGQTHLWLVMSLTPAQISLWNWNSYQISLSFPPKCLAGILNVSLWVPTPIPKPVPLPTLHVSAKNMVFTQVIQLKPLLNLWFLYFPHYNPSSALPFQPYLKSLQLSLYLYSYFPRQNFNSWDCCASLTALRTVCSPDSKVTFPNHKRNIFSALLKSPQRLSILQWKSPAYYKALQALASCLTLIPHLSFPSPTRTTKQAFFDSQRTPLKVFP